MGLALIPAAPWQLAQIADLALPAAASPAIADDDVNISAVRAKNKNDFMKCFLGLRYDLCLNKGNKGNFNGFQIGWVLLSVAGRDRGQRGWTLLREQLTSSAEMVLKGAY